MSRPSPEIITVPIVKTHASNYDSSYTRFLGNAEAYRREYTGTVTPGFVTKSARERKKLPVNDYKVTYTKRSSTFYHETGWAKYYGAEYSTSESWSNFLFNLGSPSVTHHNEAYTKARARCAASASKMSVNLAQMMGEMHQTANLVTNTARRLVSLAVAIRKADLSYLMRHYNGATRKFASKMKSTPESERLATYWLEYQYGWKPLIQDVYGCFTLLSEHLRTDLWHGFASGSATHKTSESDVSYWVTTTKTHQTKVSIKLRYTMEDSDRVALSTTGLDNPALLAWELLPYSFVVDWFVPVGNYLEALNAFAGYKFYDGYVSYSSKLLYTENRDRSWSTPTSYFTTSGSGSHRSEEYKRVKLGAFPGVGNLTVKNPLGGEPIARFVTSLALLRTAFK